MSRESVSVIIPSFKMGQFIGEALESVGAQTYPHWEVIVVDDAGPEDGTRGAVEAFATKHANNRVEYIRHETNQGVSAARNTAIETAKGEFVAFLDPDDVWSKNYLAETCGHLANHPQVDLVYTSKIPIDEQSQEIGGVAKPTFEELRDFPQSLYYRNWINPSQAVCRRHSLPSPTFDMNLNHVEDLDLWIRMACAGATFSYLDEPLSYYRRHSGSATKAAAEVDLERHYRLWAKHCDKHDYALALARQLRDSRISHIKRSHVRQTLVARFLRKLARMLDKTRS